MTLRVAPRLPRTVPLAATAALLMLLTGCGIRATEVPTDFGPAPSRAPCTMSAPAVEPRAGTVGFEVQIFLVCSSQLVTVDRTVEISGKPPQGDRVRVARALLGQLKRLPSSPERQAGYTTDIRRTSTVAGPRLGDPSDTLRLSTPPEELSAFALAQLICTYANSAAADERGGVTLGGPGDEPVRRYECTDEVRSRPGTDGPPSTVVSGA